MIPDHSRAAERRLRRASNVLAACLRRADLGDAFFVSHRAELEHIKRDLADFESGSMGRKRLVAASERVSRELQTLEAAYLEDRRWQQSEQERFAASRREEERRQHLLRTQVAQQEDAKLRARPPLTEVSLSVLYDLRNQ